MWRDSARALTLSNIGFESQCKKVKREIVKNEERSVKKSHKTVVLFIGSERRIYYCDRVTNLNRDTQSLAEEKSLSCLACFCTDSLSDLFDKIHG